MIEMLFGAGLLLIGILIGAAMSSGTKKENNE